MYGRQTKKQYVIQHVAKAKHLRPPLTKVKLILHQDILSETPSVTNVYEHTIIVEDESKFVSKTYQVSMHFQQLVDQEIQGMVENNIYEMSDSSFINPLVIVKKKN